MLQFSHKDMDGMILTNKNQKKIVKSVKEKIDEHIKNQLNYTGISSTFAPYYDIVLNEQEKQKLTETKVSSIVSDKVKQGSVKILLKDQNDHISKAMIKYMPKKTEKSEILSDIQISNLVENLPSMLKMADWSLAYSINRDGVSMGTFFQQCKDWRYALLVIKDTSGWVFGGFTCETWKKSTKFYGTGESFLFTLKDGNDPEVYRWTGENDQI